MIRAHDVDSFFAGSRQETVQEHKPRSPAAAKAMPWADGAKVARNGQRTSNSRTPLTSPTRRH